MTLPCRAGRLAQALEKDTADQAFDPPYSTLHTGAIQSGDALNFVPGHATLAFEIRSLQGVDVSSLLRSIDEILVAESFRLQAKAAESRIVVEELAAYPALDAPTAVPTHLPGFAEVAGMATARACVRTALRLKRADLRRTPYPKRCAMPWGPARAACAP
jgi:acetylornithine deacetylase/succinyl-diaminopimelate desuccinylase-like protein